MRIVESTTDKTPVFFDDFDQCAGIDFVVGAVQHPAENPDVIGRVARSHFYDRKHIAGFGEDG